MSRGTLVGVPALLRLALRRDRVRIPAWLVVLVGLLGAQVAGIEQAYPEPSDRVTYATVMSSSAAARVFGSPDGTSLGAITMVEIYATLCVLAAIMCLLTVVRHTRQDEQAGRLELVGATVVGRHSGLATALLLAAGSMAVLAVASTAVLVAFGLPLAGSVVMACSIAGTGIVFAGVAAVASQVAGTARGAGGLAGAVLGSAFVLRAVGSVTGELRSDGLGVVIAWPAWSSPIAWGELAYPFTAMRWQAALAYPAAACLLAGLAALLAARRDVGRGMLRQRPARPAARRWLSTPLGLAVRQQRGAWAAWGAGAHALGVTTGVFTEEFESMLADNDAARQLFAAVGGAEVLRDNALAMMMSSIAITLSAFVVQSMLRMHAEEELALDALLATATSRIRWMTSHVATALVGAALLLLLAGAAAGGAAALVTGDGSLLGVLLLAGAVQVPAVVLVGAVCALGYGISPRLAAPFGWGMFAVCLLTLVGDMLRLPEQVLDLSPFAHVPLLPAQELDVAPLAAMLAVSAALVAAGIAMFRRRDIGIA